MPISAPNSPMMADAPPRTSASAKSCVTMRPRRLDTNVLLLLTVASVFMESVVRARSADPGLAWQDVSFTRQEFTGAAGSPWLLVLLAAGLVGTALLATAMRAANTDPRDTLCQE